MVESVAELVGFEIATLSVVLDGDLVTVAYTGPDEHREFLMNAVDPVSILDPVLERAESWGRFRFLDADVHQIELEGHWVMLAPDRRAPRLLAPRERADRAPRRRRRRARRPAVGRPAGLGAAPRRRAARPAREVRRAGGARRNHRVRARGAGAPGRPCGVGAPADPVGRDAGAGVAGGRAGAHPRPAGRGLPGERPVGRGLRRGRRQLGLRPRPRWARSWRSPTRSSTWPGRSPRGSGRRSRSS